jgi:hypothetical protein
MLIKARNFFLAFFIPGFFHFVGALLVFISPKYSRSDIEDLAFLIQLPRESSEIGPEDCVSTG